MNYETFLLILDERIISKIILQQKYLLYSSHLQKKNRSYVECNIVDFDVSGAKEKDGEKFDEIKDIKSQVQEHEGVGSPHVQESEDDKPLDEHSEGEEWLESCESVDLSDYGVVIISKKQTMYKRKF